jgi:hypothetical protein
VKVGARREVAKLQRVVVVIDPQDAFCHEDGSLARAFGVQELERIRQCLAALEALMEGGLRELEAAGIQIVQGRRDRRQDS